MIRLNKKEKLYYEAYINSTEESKQNFVKFLLRCNTQYENLTELIEKQESEINDVIDKLFPKTSS